MLSLIAAALAPGIALMAYFYLKDRYESEPIHMVIRLFVCGALVVYPLMVVQRMLVLAFGENSILFSFGYSAGMEEAVKWFILYLFIFRHVEFDEPYDGIVYSVAVALGFASVENVVYAIYSYSSFAQLIGRALLPVSGHALFGVVMGYYVGLAKFRPKYRTLFIVVSLLMPVLYHGLFDYILLKFTDTWLWFMIPLMGYLWIRSMWKVKKANAFSPLRSVGDDEIKMPV